MKRLFKHIVQLSAAFFLFLPAAAFAADLSVDPDAFQLDVQSEQIPTGREVNVTALVQNLSDEVASAELILQAGEETVDTTDITLEPGAEEEILFTWETPSEATMVSLQAFLRDQDPADENPENDTVQLLNLEIGQAAEESEDAQAGEDSEGTEQEEQQEEETSESDGANTREEDSKEVVQLDETDIPPVMIHVEQLGWNTFRFRPSYRLGEGDYEFEWDLGDGSTKTERVFEYEYDGPGAYPVTLTLFDGDRTETAQTQVHIGFFHLANWMLWVLIGVLALIIIVAAIIAGVTDDLVEAPSGQKRKRKAEKQSGDQQEGTEEETVMNTLSDSSGDLDMMAAMGERKEDFADDLAFLEELDGEDEPIEESDESVLAELDKEEEGEETAAKEKKTSSKKKDEKPATEVLGKKTPKSEKSSKKKATKSTAKKKTSSTKKKTGEKKSTPKKKTTKKSSSKSKKK